jgi:uncharacterized protein with HEPN domain
MQLETEKLLFDVQRACELLEQFVHGKTLQDYLADALLRSGVERQLGIIGEALHQALQTDADLESFITDLWQIVRFRNILIHAYSIVRHETVWGILQANLPVLRKEVRTLLAGGQSDAQDAPAPC